jgi:hypothetical protein
VDRQVIVGGRLITGQKPQAAAGAAIRDALLK